MVSWSESQSADDRRGVIDVSAVQKAGGGGAASWRGVQEASSCRAESVGGRGSRTVFDAGSCRAVSEDSSQRNPEIKRMFLR